MIAAVTAPSSSAPHRGASTWLASLPSVVPTPFQVSPSAAITAERPAAVSLVPLGAISSSAAPPNSSTTITMTHTQVLAQQHRRRRAQLDRQLLGGVDVVLGLEQLRGELLAGQDDPP